MTLEPWDSPGGLPSPPSQPLLPQGLTGGPCTQRFLRQSSGQGGGWARRADRKDGEPREASCSLRPPACQAASVTTEPSLDYSM